jgi:glycosyltransferase involved in cell wall biosynthesis
MADDVRPAGRAPRLLLLALAYPDVAVDSNLYTDLAGELLRRGVDLRVVAPGPDRTTIEGGVGVLRVGSGRLLDVGLVRKGINNLLLPLRYGRALRSGLGDWVPDWIVVPTPPITLTPLVGRLKRRWGARVYLVLRDIFPQNAVDLGLFRRRLRYAAFRRLERQAYDVADVIGCMSPANARYVLDHNPAVAPAKVVAYPNWIADHLTETRGDRAAARRHWGVADTDFLCVFGGNLGRPQRVDFLLDVAAALRDAPSVRFVIVGDGTERAGLERAIGERGLTHVALHARLPRDRYQALLTAAVAV